MSTLVLGGILCSFGGVILLGWTLYDRYFHPAWRRERRLIRACDKAFGVGNYTLRRLQVAPTSKRFEYEVVPREGRDFSCQGLHRSEAQTLRRAKGTPTTPYYRKTTIREMDEDGVRSARRDQQVSGLLR